MENLDFTGCCSILVTGCSMFVNATECVMQLIEHRVSRIQHRSFDGNYFAPNCNADLIEFMKG